jgi:hypothetical protein
MSVLPPPSFDEHFLAWLQTTSEARWKGSLRRHSRKDDSQSIREHPSSRDLRWLHGLTEEEILQVEQQWSWRFPPDYRLFLSCLHTVDHPITLADERRWRFPATYPSFHHWLTETETIQKQMDLLLEGILFDVEHGIWCESWGNRPAELHAQKAQVKMLYDQAPRLIPLRYPFAFLLGEPFQWGNPVFSIHQTDIVVWRSDLYHYLCHFVGIEQPRTQILEKREVYERIPFWGGMLRGLN